MKLKYSLLLRTEGGQGGTRGTPIATDLLPSPALPHIRGTEGDNCSTALQCPPVSPACPTANGSNNHRFCSVSHLSPVVPSPEGLIATQREWFEERAAIIEYDGRLSRLDAELRAAFLLRLTGN